MLSSVYYDSNNEIELYIHEYFRVNKIAKMSILLFYYPNCHIALICGQTTSITGFQQLIPTYYIGQSIVTITCFLFFLRAFVYLCQNNYVEAHASFIEVLKIDPKNPVVSDRLTYIGL